MMKSNKIYAEYKLHGSVRIIINVYGRHSLLFIHKMCSSVWAQNENLLHTILLALTSFALASLQ